jgi:hypothetical protein
MGMKKSVDTGRGLVMFEIDGHEAIAVRLADLSADIVTRAALHGLSQKIGDAGALSAGASDAERYEAVRELADHIREAQSYDDWNRKASGDGSSGDGLLVRALVELGADRDAARAKVAAMDKKTQAAVRGMPEVSAVIARLKAPKNPAIGANALAGLLGRPVPETDAAPF